jgi:hypothetical protein
MDINDKALEHISQWLSQIGGVAPGVNGGVRTLRLCQASSGWEGNR